MSSQIVARKELFNKQALNRLILPLMVEQFLAVTIGMADTVMVTSVGEAAVSGISLVDSINILLIQIFSALATGGAVVASQYLGRREQENACKAAKQLLYSSTLLALLIMVLSLVFHRVILRTIFGNIESQVMQNCEIYFRLSVISYPFLALYNGGAALFRSMGNSKVSMFISFLMNVVNISGNALLIFGFQWGVAGAATASLVSRALGAVIILFLICNRDNPVHVERLFHFEFHFSMVKRILRIGVPNGLENSMFQVGKLLVLGLVSTFGTAAIAANAIANNVASLATLPGMAIGLGMVTVVGQCMGARDPEQAVRYVKKLMKLTFLCMGALNLLILVFIGPLVGLFNLSPAAVENARQVLIFHSIFCLFAWPLAFTLPNALRASGDAKFTMIVSLISMWIFRIGLSYVLAQFLNLGLLGVWLAMIFDWCVRAVVFTVRFARGKWKKIQVI